MSHSKDELIYMAQICEQTERYDDILAYMRKVLDMNADLSVEDRNLLSVRIKTRSVHVELRGVFYLI